MAEGKINNFWKGSIPDTTISRCEDIHNGFKIKVLSDSPTPNDVVFCVDFTAVSNDRIQFAIAMYSFGTTLYCRKYKDDTWSEWIAL